ncbi:MAG: M20/M25/M40 family metallo-hydrolase [Firmicutes bacterium]|nr:M20/M25/M40 family metallo-hydrolase [Bacillota bacterium]
MKKVLRESLFELVQLCAPSGHEDRVATYLSKNLRQYVDEIEIDAIGNVIAYRRGRGNVSLILMAHMDEVSLVVRDVDEYVWFERVGWINEKVLMGTAVNIIGRDGDVTGVICSASAHFEETGSGELWIDVGNRQESVAIGDPITFAPNARWLDEEKRFLASKSVDDRVGCAILLDVAKRLMGQDLNCNVYFVGSVREEVGSQGAAYISSRLKADFMIALDTAFANDAAFDRHKIVGLSEGPVLRKFQMSQPVGSLYPAKVLYSNKELDEMLVAAAERLGVKLNPDIYARTFTDTTIASEVNPALRCSTLMIPRRYSHSPIEVVDVRNAEMASDILVDMLMNMP